ncbi:MAG: hypothetical protein R3F59_07850 [Myxococcota bacterium]
MIRSLTALSLLLVAACSGSDGVAPPVVDDYTPPPNIDTGWPAGDLASLQIVHSVNDDETKAYGVFADSAPSFLNLAECSIDGTICINGFPDVDDWEELDPDQEAERESIVTRFAGYDIKMGSYTLPYREDPDTHFGFYYFDAGSDNQEGLIDLAWGGQLEAVGYDEEEKPPQVYVPPPIELQKPAAGDHITFTNNEFVPFEWVPTGEGEVTLAVFTRFTLARQYQLKDDGYFELDADSLGLSGTTEDLTFLFTRWLRTDVNYKGHSVKFIASSEAYFTGQYIQVGSRDFLSTPDECTEAEGRAALEAGNWWGYLGNSVNADYTANCLNGGFDAGSAGRDGVFRIDIQPKHSIGIEYNTFDESASIYLASSCNNVENNSCFVGNDTSPDPNTSEYVQYFNPDDEMRSVYVVLDTTESGPTVYTLDMTDDELGPPDMYDNCADAQAALSSSQTLQAANYYADFTAYTNTLNPGSGGCTGTSLPGPESMVPVTLQSGETLQVNVSMPTGDPAVYLLYNCQNTVSCTVGADDSLGSSEAVTYQNQSAGTENLYIVVDSKVSMQPYFLGVQIY